MSIEYLESFAPLSPEGIRHADAACAFLEMLPQSKGRQWYGRPLELIPWQRGFVRELFGRRDPATGLRRYRTAFLFIPKKNGKALAVDTPIPTPGGWCRMGDLVAGDTVFDEHGRPIEVRHAMPAEHGRPCYRVRFSDGTSIVADAEHAWRTTTYRPENVTAIRTTAEIAASLEWDTPSAVASGVVAKNHRVAVAGALVCPQAMLPVAPYVLGYWLGDGVAASARITIGRQDAPAVMRRIRATGTPCSARGGTTATLVALTDGNRTQRARNVSVQARLRALGVLGDKHIPASYLRASYEQRLELLRGLMDSDGHISRAGQCTYDTTSVRLRDGALELLRGLGLKPRLQSRRATLNGRDCGPAWRISFYAYADQRVAHLERKAKRQVIAPRTRARSRSRQIVAVDPCLSVPVRCIEVDSPTGMFLAGESMIPTHNSTLAAGLVLKLLVADQELGAECYGAAYDKDQARIVYKVAKAMVEQNAELAKMCHIVEHKSLIEFPTTRSEYYALAHDTEGSHGFNIHGLVVDEFHTWKDGDLYQTLDYGTASREQPLTVVITTAGVFDPESPCYKLYTYAKEVRDGLLDDPTFLPLIFEAPEELEDGTPTDWEDPTLWYEANPSLGITVPEAYLTTKARKAREIATDVLNFRRLHLNQWPEQLKGWLRMDKWKACGTLPFSEESLRGRRAWLGLDVGDTQDLTALGVVVPLEDGTIAVTVRVFCPDEQIARRTKRDKVPYDLWSRAGFIQRTEGSTTDFAAIRAEVHRLAEYFEVAEVCVDPWNALQLSGELIADGFAVVKIPQTTAHINNPAKAFERAVTDGRLRHGNNPVLTWCASNATVRMDAHGNIKPDKARSKERIDPVVALINGLARALGGSAEGSGWLAGVTAS